MKEENKPKLMFWLCAVQFVFSILVLGMNIPARMFVRQHGGPDKLVEGGYCQLRKIGDSGFVLHLWSIDVACSSGLVGVLVFLALFIVICRMGWTRLIRKIRNPTHLTKKEPHLMRHVPAKMVFLHPRVLISAGLWTNLFVAATACISVYASYGNSDHLDLTGSGPRYLGEFDIEAYLCELLPWMLSDQSEMALMMARERCALARFSRWLLLFSAIFSFFQFIICVWVVDSISRPVSAALEKKRARQRREQRARSHPERARSSALESFPDVDRVGGMF
ncbi:alpha-l-rhamnosidase protein [Diplodia corticola]|uniref:Alpha-l-rhamnosidase protein n=1 Tax=Diplodia corticola TaxID=236234 RepID=A0A1J9S0A4_9PEZI|nr:alpha-l-rhamnosidase protein [Diplodia corticola]OJD34015.1 alpha-l-rhamnosidase protein [Diplodia corticola]